jgi:hypothetical protein
MTDSPLPNPPVEAEAEDPLAFTPVPSRRNRHDGWTPDVQRRFIAAIEETAVVASAAKAVGMSVTSAYALRKRPGAESFAAAWDIALAMARDRAWDAVRHHLRHGRTVPLFYRGGFTGTSHRIESRMLLAALRAMDAQERRLG